MKNWLVNIIFKQLFMVTFISLFTLHYVNSANQDISSLSEREDSEAEEDYEIPVTFGLQGALAEDMKMKYIVVIYPNKSELKKDIQNKEILNNRWNLNPIRLSDLHQGKFEVYYLGPYSDNNYIQRIKCNFKNSLNTRKKITKIRLHAQSKVMKHTILTTCNMEIIY